jgi:RNA polymerase sigma-70 factor (ECF subfamily)
MLESNRALLEGYRRGNRATLEAVYRHCSPLVLRALSHGFCVRSKGAHSTVQVSPLDLDAAHQETFVRVFGESARLHYDGLKPFEPYVLAIARSAAVDVLRAQGKLHSESIALDDVDEWLADPGPSPETLALQAEAEAVVRGFLATLSPVDLRFATARFIDGLSQEKAGALCGLTRQEARTKESKLKAACLTHLSQRGFLEAAAASRAMLALLVVLLYVKGSHVVL